VRLISIIWPSIIMAMTTTVVQLTTCLSQHRKNVYSEAVSTCIVMCNVLFLNLHGRKVVSSCALCLGLNSVNINILLNNTLMGPQ